MFCHACGASAAGGIKFCSSCGASLDAGADGAAQRVASAAVVSSPAAGSQGVFGDASSDVKIMYILYILGFFTGITAFIAVIWAYINKSKAPQWTVGHHGLMISTFWKSLMLGALLLLIITVMTFIGGWLSVTSFGPAAYLGGAVLFLVAALSWMGFLGLFVWSVIRIAKGLMMLMKEQAVSNPSTWGLPK